MTYIKNKGKGIMPGTKPHKWRMYMKKLTTLITALALTAMISVSAQAATLKCTVEKVEGNIVTMNCGDKAASLSTGTKVKVKTAKAKSAAIEGC
jgi:pyrrolidone-carboxylate peptidase